MASTSPSLITAKPSPRFMSPTLSSSKMPMLISTKDSDASSPLKPVRTERERKVSSNWMASAARRVGVGRVSSRNVDSKKNKNLSKQRNSIACNNNYPSPARANVNGKQHTLLNSGQISANKLSPLDKPLPRPPVEEDLGNSPACKTRTLIDAAEKPLKRASPDGDHAQHEDWPTLEPQQSTTRGSTKSTQSRSQKSTARASFKSIIDPEENTSLSCSLDYIKQTNPIQNARLLTTQSEEPVIRKESYPKEKYPNLEIGTENENEMCKLRPDKPFPKGKNLRGTALDRSVRYTSDIPTYAAQPWIIRPGSSTTRLSSSINNKHGIKEDPIQKERNSAKARYADVAVPGILYTTVEHSSCPRENLDSSLRDKNSAGNLENENSFEGNKCLGLTDDHNTAELRSKVAAVLAGPPTSSASKAPRGRRMPPKARNDEQAQIDKREKVVQNPTIKRAFRPSITSLPRLADKPAPASQEPSNTGGLVKAVPTISKGNTKPNSRHSCIPKYHTIVQNPIERNMMLSNSATSGSAASTSISKIADTSSKAFKALTEPSPPSRISKNARRPHTYARATKALSRDFRRSHLPLINLTPKPVMITKTLSRSPSVQEYGPQLRICTSAEEIIMGKDDDNGNGRKLKEDSQRTAITSQLKRAVSQAKGKNENKLLQPRPLTSQGLLRSATSSDFLAPVPSTRSKSVDLIERGSINQAIVNNHLEQKPVPVSSGSVSSHPVLLHFTPQSSVSSAGDDPFFDAHSQAENGNGWFENVVPPRRKSSSRLRKSFFDNESMITTTSVDECVIPINTELSSVHEQSDISGDCYATDETAETCNHENGLMSPSDVQLEENQNKEAIWGPESSSSSLACQTLGSLSSNYPMRKSSHAAAYEADFTVHESAKPLRRSLSVAEMKNNAGRKLPRQFQSVVKKKDSPDFVNRQNNLGFKAGLGSCQLRLSNTISQEYSISQSRLSPHSSLSKGVRSTVRGFFHKRSQDLKNRECDFEINDRSKSKIAIPKRCSPFPSISEVHPIHRPSLSGKEQDGSIVTRPMPLGANMTMPSIASTPFVAGIKPNLSLSTSITMELLEQVKRETSSPHKENMLDLGKLMVEAVTQARDAERAKEAAKKAMEAAVLACEEAKLAARGAEVASLVCEKYLEEITEWVKAWKRDYDADKAAERAVGGH